MWRWKPAGSERPRSSQLTFIFLARDSANEVSLHLIQIKKMRISKSFPAPSCLSMFLAPLSSPADSCQLVSGSIPWCKVNFITAVLEFHGATKCPVTGFVFEVGDCQPWICPLAIMSFGPTIFTVTNSSIGFVVSLGSRLLFWIR